jgi:hypothetical protein
MNILLQTLPESYCSAEKIDYSNSQINLHALKQGVYLVTVKNNNYLQTDRIILQ